MPMYADPYLLLDTSYLVAATIGNGDGPCDGSYWIMCLVDIGGKAKRCIATYPHEASRDYAFAALSARLAAAPAKKELPHE